MCTRLPHESKADRRVTVVWDVAATTNAICELAAHLVELRIERVVLESTSDYVRHEGAWSQVGMYWPTQNKVSFIALLYSSTIYGR